MSAPAAADRHPSSSHPYERAMNADIAFAPAAHPVPHAPAVIAEQLRAVGRHIRREVLGLGILLLVMAGTLLAAHATIPGHRSDFQFAEMALAACLLALFAPLAVWRGEEPSRRAYFWSLPVERGSHTLLKVLAGWAWLMAVVGGFLLVIALLARATDGALSLGPALLPLRELPEGTERTMADVFHHPWPMAPWQWLAPFAGATVMYLLGSILVLSTDHPWRWIAGLLFGAMLVAALGTELGGRTVQAVAEGPYGLALLVTGGREALGLPVRAPTGQVLEVSAFVPDPAGWARAAALWTALSLAGVLAAAFRHQER